jgi:23S rRNA (guanine745-N1)-methyltransferase
VATLGALTCARGHNYDVARRGYVSLLPPRKGHAVGDDPDMVRARARVEEAGHLRPLTSVLAETALTTVGTEARLVLDTGAGTGRHLARCPRRAAARHWHRLGRLLLCFPSGGQGAPSAAAVRADAWREIPLRDRTVDLALSVYAPRNGLELARVLRRDATLIVVSAAPGHIQELRPLHTIGVNPRKSDRFSRQLSTWFPPVNTDQIVWTLKLTREQAAAVLGMVPAAKHLKPDFNRRLSALDEPIVVTAAADLRVFRRECKARFDSSARNRRPKLTTRRCCPANQPDTVNSGSRNA